MSRRVQKSRSASSVLTSRARRLDVLSYALHANGVVHPRSFKRICFPSLKIGAVFPPTGVACEIAYSDIGKLEFARARHFLRAVSLNFSYSAAGPRAHGSLAFRLQLRQR